MLSGPVHSADSGGRSDQGNGNQDAEVMMNLLAVGD